MFFVFPAFAEHVPGQLFIKFRPTVVINTDGIKEMSISGLVIDSASLTRLNSKYKVKNITSITKHEKISKRLRSGKMVDMPDISNIYLVNMPKEENVLDAARDYQNDPAVEYACPNYIRKITATPNDPYYKQNPNADPNQWGLFKIGCKPIGSGESGWDIEKGTNEVKVAVIDTGANYLHPDLMGRLNSLEGYDFANGDNDPMDDHGHGSHVSGIIGASTNNSAGIAGVDWNCRIVPIKAFDAGGSGSDEAIFHAIRWAADMVTADVINMSFGGYDDSPLISDIVAYAATSDCLMVAAAGNENTSDHSFPASYDHVLSVAATDPNDHKTSYSDFGSAVDVSAPGGESNYSLGPQYYINWILSTYKPMGGDPNKFAWMQGTSMASPFVAGLAALLRSKFPTDDADTIAQRIKDYADNIDSYNPSYKGLIGSGRINVGAALGGLNPYISEPASGETVYGNISIKGRATGEGFVKYTVLVNLYGSADAWTTIESSTNKVIDGPLATYDTKGLDAWISIKLRLNDLATREMVITVHAGSKEKPILSGRAEYGPNPFNPKNGQLLITYKLTRNSDVHIYFFDLTGGLICRKFYSSGIEGGSQGTNRVYWDGVNDYGDRVANGVYLFRIESEGRTIGKGKIIVLK